MMIIYVDRRSEISFCERRLSRKTTLFTEVDDDCFFSVLKSTDFTSQKK